jgi:hypothetical protein
MMTSPAAPLVGGASKGAAADVPPEPERTKRSVRPPLERAEILADTSGVSARDQPLIPIINWLLELVQSDYDPEQAKEILEGTRQALIDEALAMQQERDKFNREVREYEAAQGFTPVVTRPSQIDEVRTRGRDLNIVLEKDTRTRAHSATSTVPARPKPIYSSPVKNLRPAAEVAKELPSLSGEALREKPGLTIFCLKLVSNRRPLRRRIQVSEVACALDLRAISSLNSKLSSSSNHHSSKRSRGRRKMCGSIRMSALVKKGSGQSIPWVWPWTGHVVSILSSRISRRIT